MPTQTNTPKKTLSPYEEAVAAVLEALAALSENPLDLPAQVATTYVMKKVGGIPLYWTQGLNSESPFYVTSTLVGVPELNLLGESQEIIATYFRDGSTWRRHAITANFNVILASLPRHAMNPPAPNAPATAPQLVALRKALRLPVDHPLPTLHKAKASQCLDRLFLARKLPGLARDMELWIRSAPAELAA